MTRQRLRRAHSQAALATIYAEPHDHTRWADHIDRVNATIDFAQGFLAGPVGSVADLACGSAAIPRGIDADRYFLGDVAAGYEFHGPIEETIHDIPPVDVFVCCETVEHLDDPDTVLRAIRGKAGRLVLSTPVGAWDDDNIEHYWAWGRGDVDAMLGTAGWTVAAYRELPPFFYRFGLWGCV